MEDVHSVALGCTHEKCEIQNEKIELEIEAYSHFHTPGQLLC